METGGVFRVGLIFKLVTFFDGVVRVHIGLFFKVTDNRGCSNGIGGSIGVDVLVRTAASLPEAARAEKASGGLLVRGDIA